MDEARSRPKAREGLLATDHSKRGRRFVTILDPSSLQVTLLEPWEHAILVLCDGTREVKSVVELLAPSVEGQPIDREVVVRCLKFFERQGLTHDAGLRESNERPPGPRTMAELQQAYREWHSEPYKTGQFPELVPPPFPGTSPRVVVGLSPTVVLPDGGKRTGTIGIGSTLVLAGSESLLSRREDDDNATDAFVPSVQGSLRAEALPEERPLDDREVSDLIDVLRAVDSAVAEADALELDRREHLAEPPRAELIQRARSSRAEPDAALRPTMVGVPAERPREPAWDDDDSATYGEVPAYEEKTTRTRWPRGDASPRRKAPTDVDTDLSRVVPSESYGEDEQSEDTASGARPASRTPDRARTVSTGVRPPAGNSRELFERVRRTGADLGRHATTAEVIAALDPDDAEGAADHFRYLADRLPRARSAAAFASALESLVDAGADTDEGLPAGVARAVFGPALLAVVDEAVSAGRCPACLARQQSKLVRCGQCGFEPPRRRR